MSIVDEANFAANAAAAFTADPSRVTYAEAMLAPGSMLALRHNEHVLIVKLDPEHEPTLWNLIRKEAARV